MSAKSGRSSAGVIVAAVCALLLAAAAELQAVRERRYPSGTEMEESLYLTSGTTARRLAGAFASVAADLYWVRAIQHYGATKLRVGATHQSGLEPPPLIAAPPDEYKLLYPLLDLTTTLDPRFNIAYRFGAVFLAEPFPGGAGRTDLAIALLEKGLRERPGKWEYLQDIGFVHYWYDHDYRAAADAFNRAADVPGAPWWLRSLAATTVAKGGDRQSSRLMWQAILQSAEVDFQRKDAEHRLLQFRALDEIDALQRAVDAYATRTGTRPTEWTALARAGVLRGIPIDPTGERYLLTSEGKVRLSNASTLGPLPDESTSDARPPA